MNPHDIEMEDISNVYFDTILGVSNMRQFKAQETVDDHQVEERDINNGLHVGVGLHDKGSDSVLRYLHEQWLQEDIVTGVMKIHSETRHVCVGAPSLFGAAK